MPTRDALIAAIRADSNLGAPRAADLDTRDPLTCALVAASEDPTAHAVFASASWEDLHSIARLAWVQI
ncbi:MAG: hypothetical protein AAGI01_18500, partial [Myxococcota bacterium]